MRIIFMGTPEFAVTSLQWLHDKGCHIVGVVTAADKPKGRGRKLQSSAIKVYAQSVGLHILQPKNLKSESFLEELRSLKADLQIVVAFRMLPEVVWSMPPLGTFNLHASWLPKYRGAAPIHWAIINGEKETGVTTFFLKHEIDTGDIILQEKEDIKPQDTVGDLYERLSQKGARLVWKTVCRIQNSDYTLLPQSYSSPLKPAPKLTPEVCRIDWHQKAEQIKDFIRGLSPQPAAWTHWQGQRMKVFNAQIAELNSMQDSPRIGDFRTDGKTYLSVQTKDHPLALLDIQVEGKKRMKVREFLRGH